MRYNTMKGVIYYFFIGIFSLYFLFYNVNADANTNINTVKVCTFSQSPTHLVNIKIARAIFKEIGLPYTILNLQAGSEYKIMDLLKKSCNVFMGVPISSDVHQFNNKILISPSYLRVNFVKFSIDSVFKANRSHDLVAVAYKSPSMLIAIEENDAESDIEDTTADVINAVITRKAEYGITWYPALVIYEHTHPQIHFYISKTHTQMSNWKLSFTADNNNHYILTKISSAIQILSNSGVLHSITAPWELNLIRSGNLYHHTSSITLTAHNLSSIRSIVPNKPKPSPHEIPRGSIAVFSVAQVTAGRKLFRHECSECHGLHIQGKVGPTLVGPGFAPKLNSTMTKAGIFQYMKTNMPANKPGQLTPPEYTEIFAYLLHMNGYRPSGRKLSSYYAMNDSSPFNSFVTDQHACENARRVMSGSWYLCRDRVLPSVDSMDSAKADVPAFPGTVPSL